MLLSVAGLISASHVMAQESDEKVVEGRMHTIIYKTGGTKVEGYLQNSFSLPGYGFSRSYFIPSAMDTAMIVKPQNKPFERSIKVRNCEIDSMMTWLDKTPEDKQKWEESLYLDKVEQELMVVKEQDKEKAALAVVAVGTEVYQMAEEDLAI